MLLLGSSGRLLGGADPERPLARRRTARTLTARSEELIFSVFLEHVFLQERTASDLSQRSGILLPPHVLGSFQLGMFAREVERVERREMFGPDS